MPCIAWTCFLLWSQDCSLTSPVYWMRFKTVPYELYVCRMSNWARALAKSLSLPRNSVIRLTDHHNITIAVYHECKKTTQQHTHTKVIHLANRPSWHPPSIHPASQAFIHKSHPQPRTPWMHYTGICALVISCEEKLRCCVWSCWKICFETFLSCFP